MYAWGYMCFAPAGLGVPTHWLPFLAVSMPPFLLPFSVRLHPLVGKVFSGELISYCN